MSEEIEVRFKHDTDSVTGSAKFPWQAICRCGGSRATVYAKTMDEAQEKAKEWVLSREKAEGISQ